ncbi:FapA family protein [Brevibacillus brevis]|uniref:FapA family protein n=1 Tax=Brevibacillus brevis TaxID=1393 RepID=A0ABY9SXI4_BREBE|nr:FapA family protein [Brevibacillus brevis]WNC12519.1 FapA family protein [Brevibacillus brevis]
MEAIGNYRFEVKLSADKLEAVIILRAEEEDLDNILIRESDVYEELRKHRVTFGILDNVVQDLCTLPRKFVHAQVTVARGLPPVPGTDGSVEYPYLDSVREESGPKELEDGRVDFYNLTTIPNVVKGQLLARKIPAGQGQPGKSVTGEPIIPKAGRDVIIKPGKNVVQNQERTMIYAAIDGQVSFTDQDKLNVFPVFEVNGDVDFGVGNIDFVGTVVIRGNVLNGFRVKASGDIRVLGSVEGAELIAGGSIEIKSGIVAQDKGSIVAGHDVRTSFIQNANVTAGNQVIVSQSIMFSTVRAGKQILCKGAKGIIIGGVLQAGEKIAARVFGNTSATPTVLEVGVKPELRQELVQIQKELQQVYENLRKTDQGLSVMNQILQTSGELPPDKKMLQIKLTNTRLVLEKECKTLEARKKDVETELKGEGPAAIEAYHVMYPGIKMTFGKLVHFIKHEYARTRFVVLDGEISTATLI